MSALTNLVGIPFNLYTNKEFLSLVDGQIVRVICVGAPGNRITCIDDLVLRKGEEENCYGLYANEEVRIGFVFSGGADDDPVVDVAHGDDRYYLAVP